MSLIAGWISATLHSKDGHSPYLNLHGNYLGVKNVDNMSTLADLLHMMERSTIGSSKKYMKVHIDEHAILAGLVEHGYSGIDERSKVSHLMQGIKTHDLDPVKTQI